MNGDDFYSAPVEQQMLSHLVSSLLCLFVRGYQVSFSNRLGMVCRFEPSCSKYALLCIETHGPWRGSLLSIYRLCKCHPFHSGGYDPPPEKE